MIRMSDASDAIASTVQLIHGDAQLDQLAARLASSRIVMLGEGTHGTHEFYDLRAALSRRLIARHGFTAIAIEGDWPDALRVDRFVRGHGEDPRADDALGGFARFPRWLWRNDDVRSFASWLRQVNVARPPERRVGFYGLDLYSLHASMKAVLSYLDEVDPAAAARARARYACFEHVADPEAYGARASLGVARDCEDAVVAQLTEMQVRYAARSGKSPRQDAWFHAMQEAHVVRDAEAYYRAMFGAHDRSWNLRDTHMADTLDLLASHLGGKIIVWAHNSHVGDARATEMGADDGHLTLGQLVRERHPGQSALVGFTTYDGMVIAATDWDLPYARETIRPALGGSWEALFHATGLPRFVVSTEALGPRRRRV